MSEQGGKATRLADELRRRAASMTPEEQERRRAEREGLRPPLRLRQEVLDRALDADASVREVLHRQGHGEGVTVLHDPATGQASVAIPVEAYLELVTSDMKARPKWVAGLEGQLRPTEEHLGQWGAEQVNPEESWTPVHRTTG